MDLAEHRFNIGWEWMIALTRHVTQRVVAMLSGTTLIF